MPGMDGIRIPASLAQRVADAAMADTGRNINIFDSRAVTIASGDPERLGLVHDGARRALQTGEPFEVAQDHGAEREGINLPFSVGDDIVGVVGITGPLDEVRPLARLTRTSVSLLLQQSLEFDRQRHQVVAAAIAAESHAYRADLVELALRYGPDLSRPQVAVLVDGETSGLAARWPAAFPLRDDLFLVAPEEVEEAVRVWADQASSAVLFVGAPHDLAKDGIDEVLRSRAVRAALDLPGRVHRVEDLSDLIALATLPRRPALAVLDSHPDLVQTLRAFIAHDMGMSATAEQLHVHRNTLLYRLQRIETLTGHDPRRLLPLITLVGHVLQTTPQPGVGSPS